MEKLKILFVCSQNRWRSLTAEKIFEHRFDLSVTSAGTEPRARVKLVEGHIGWADIIFVMEKKHRDFIVSHFADRLEEKPLIVLHIPDEYQFMDEELIDILEARVGEYLV
jgi:predicted protein tyrosine phosphatase